MNQGFGDCSYDFPYGTDMFFPYRLSHSRQASWPEEGTDVNGSQCQPTFFWAPFIQQKHTPMYWTTRTLLLKPNLLYNRRLLVKIGYSIRWYSHYIPTRSIQITFLAGYISIKPNIKLAYHAMFVVSQWIPNKSPRYIPISPLYTDYIPIVSAINQNMQSIVGYVV